MDVNNVWIDGHMGKHCQRLTMCVNGKPQTNVKEYVPMQYKRDSCTQFSQTLKVVFVFYRALCTPGSLVSGTLQQITQGMCTFVNFIITKNMVNCFTFRSPLYEFKFHSHTKGFLFFCIFLVFTPAVLYFSTYKIIYGIVCFIYNNITRHS